MRFFTVTLFMAICLYVSAHDTPIILCGRQLANARALLCYGSEYVDKRGDSSNFLLENSLDYNNHELQWPWGGRLGALSASWTRYKRQGLANECCLKSCTKEIILSYC